MPTAILDRPLAVPVYQHTPDIVCHWGHGPHADDRNKCDRQAVWILTHSCCLVQTLQCDAHLRKRERTTARHCADCGHEWPEDFEIYQRFISITRLG